MHDKKMIEDALQNPKANDVLMEMLDYLKMHDHDMYEDIEEDLYCLAYGYHFNEKTLLKALDCMENADGTMGGHWMMSDTRKVASQYNIRFDEFNEYDWCYVINMMYSDYYAVARKYNINTVEFYVEMSKAFLMDKDGVDGKAYHYYLMIKE